MNGALSDTLREAWVVTAIVGALWFGCYLYEIGFMVRFGIPPMLADIGFSRPLAAGLVAGPAGAAAASLILWPRRAAGRASREERSYLPLAALVALAVSVAALLIEDPAPTLLDGPPYGTGAHPVELVLGLSLAFYAALLFARHATLARSGRFGAIAQSSLLILLLALLPVGLGWMGAGSKMENRRSFLYLADRPDYVLVRLYEDKAIFVRYERATRRFVPDYLMHRFDGPGNAYLTRRPPAG